ncbi:MAG: aminotransferase class I/II-fold pyridoxal phosphate-dependent enzyme [Mucilaginibacter polytrichastri]|nr:aminotransferase class I/II-fold pyridoxal phosphate-dependent enzyme [Mucilaginibacter polytrichastri]
MSLSEQSKLIRTQSERSSHREHSTPLYLTSSFVFDDAEQGRALFAEELEGNVYSRYSNPNTTEFIKKVVEMERAEDGLAFSSGMAAVFASFAGILRSGDHVVAFRSVFGSTHQILTNLLPRWGITSTYVDASKPEDVEKAIRPETKMLFLETPSNPGLELVDLEWLGTLKQKYPNLILNVDNCFATPYLQKPITFGFDLVSHSATKYMDGQGRVLGGVVVGRKDLIAEMRFFIRHTGPALSPFNAWTISRSLETLPLRMDRHCSNALALAEMLEAHSETEQVRYPFLPSHPQFALAKKQMKAGGGIVTFIVKGGFERAKRFMDALQMIRQTPNLGDSRTIATHPASTTHSKFTDDERAVVNIFPGSVRISVGLEDVNDILNDIKQALESTAQKMTGEKGLPEMELKLPEVKI